MPHPYDIFQDPLAEALVPLPLALPAYALSHAPYVGPIVHHGLGTITLGLNYHIALRTRAIDDALLESIALGASQLVILGAGLDTRALRIEELSTVHVFEVDHPSTQQRKIERLNQIIPLPPTKALSLQRVAVDFEHDQLDKALLQAGFSQDLSSFWIWEGVTAYLTPQAISDTLDRIATLSAPKSRVALTYVPLPSAVPDWLMPAAEFFFRAVGEPLRTQFPPHEVKALVSRAGLRLLSDDSTVDWAQRYWPGHRGVRAIERLAVAER